MTYGGASADDTRRVINAAKSGCKCRNHLRKPKQQHASKDAALTAIIRTHSKHGGSFSAYPCPTSDKWHVRTDRKRS